MGDQRGRRRHASDSQEVPGPIGQPITASASVVRVPPKANPDWTPPDKSRKDSHPKCMDCVRGQAFGPAPASGWICTSLCPAIRHNGENHELKDIRMAELLQVLVLMAAPAAVLATMGYFNRRADRQSAELDAAGSLDNRDPGVPAGTSSA